MQNQHNQLSAEALKELREIYENEFDDILTDSEIEEMGIRLIHFFHILLSGPSPARIELTMRERLALGYIDAEMAAGRNPTVRGIAQAVSLRSSRSGKRLRDGLAAKGLLKS